MTDPNAIVTAVSDRLEALSTVRCAEMESAFKRLVDEEMATLRATLATLPIVDALKSFSTAQPAFVQAGSMRMATNRGWYDKDCNGDPVCEGKPIHVTQMRLNTADGWSMDVAVTPQAQGSISTAEVAMALSGGKKLLQGKQYRYAILFFEEGTDAQGT